MRSANPNSERLGTGPIQTKPLPTGIHSQGRADDEVMDAVLRQLAGRGDGEAAHGLDGNRDGPDGGEFFGGWEHAAVLLRHLRGRARATYSFA